MIVHYIMICIVGVVKQLKHHKYHKYPFYLASTTTATPSGLKIVSMAVAICFVSLSWTWSLLEYISAILASLLNPKTLLSGIYPICTCKEDD